MYKYGDLGNYAMLPPAGQFKDYTFVLWGIVVTLNCACKSYAPIVALRVLLGCFEASVAPSLVLLTGMWYKRPEQVDSPDGHLVPGHVLRAHDLVARRLRAAALHIGYDDYDFVTVFGCTWWAGHFNQRGIANHGHDRSDADRWRAHAMVAFGQEGGRGGACWRACSSRRAWEAVSSPSDVLLDHGELRGPQQEDRDERTCCDAPEYIPAKMCIVIVPSFAILVTAAARLRVLA
ncbi:hypothetical protein F4778DRAFT_776850 [Xylariomycetidae sp. FL2044]|nr:hypothetical protein F4778DRAFT_776850 [Xylariomycetidae sp. FL2044]